MAELKSCPECREPTRIIMNGTVEMCSRCAWAAEVPNRAAPADKQGGGLTEIESAALRYARVAPKDSCYVCGQPAMYCASKHHEARVAPSVPDALNLLREIRNDDYLSDTHRHRIDRLLAAPQPSEQQAERECNSCDWKGSFADCVYCGNVGPLCPKCNETTEQAEQPAEEARGYEFKPSRHDKGAVIWAVATMLRKWSALGDNLAAHDDFTTAMAQTMIEYDSVAKTAEEARGVVLTAEQAAEIHDIMRACHRWHGGDSHSKERRERAMALLAAPAAATARDEIPTDSIDHLTRQKAAHIIARDGFRVSGVVMSKPNGSVCIVDRSAVRWLTGDELFSVMHPAAPQAATGAQGLTDFQLFEQFCDEHSIYGGDRNLAAIVWKGAQRAPATEQAEQREAPNLAVHLDNMLRLIKENRQRIGYQAGSPNDEEVKAARRALMDWTSAASQPHGGKERG